MKGTIKPVIITESVRKLYINKILRRKGKRMKFKTIGSSFKNWVSKPVSQIGVLLLMAFISFIFLFDSVKPEKLNVELYNVAETTIRSPKTIEDPVETKEKQQKAVNSVEDVYTVNKEYVKKRVNLINEIYTSAESVVSAGLKNQEVEKDKKNTAQTLLEPSDYVSDLRGKLSDNVNKDLTDETLINLLGSSLSDLSIAKDITMTSINETMKDGIRANEVENAKMKVEEGIKYSSLPVRLKSASIDLGRYAIIQNVFFDPESTERARENASESVEPVRILQGQIIAEEGYLIDADVYRQLKLVGLLNSEDSLLPYVGLVAVIVLVFAGVYVMFGNTIRNEEHEDYRDNLFIFSIVYLLALLLMKIIHIFVGLSQESIAYFFPAAMAAMLVTILMRERYAVGITIVLSVIGSIMFKEELAGTVHVTMGIYILVSGISGILLLKQGIARTSILRAGMINAIINLIVVLGLIWIGGNGINHIMILVAAIASGVISAVFTIGILPFIETGFGIFSSMRMIELSNPNHPLLRKILTEAPGTYHHSVMVANLAEAACEAIGANGLLARVGCYYHDIGKTKRPYYFIENQVNIENPHDHLSPEKSTKIIVSHVTDGAEMVKKYKMPKEIVDIVEQHHGTTQLKFFYHKACEAGGEVKEENFRYPGPKAQTKEAAIIGIADSVEAAVRSLKSPTQATIEKLVKSIIADRLNDGQLNECDLTFKELNKVSQSLCETLAGIFHNRIEYPELEKE